MKKITTKRIKNRWYQDESLINYDGNVIGRFAGSGEHIKLKKIKEKPGDNPNDVWEWSRTKAKFDTMDDFFAWIKEKDECLKQLGEDLKKAEKRAKEYSPQYQEEILEEIQVGRNANDILSEALPNAEKEFKRITNSLIKLMKEVKREFPDACLYTGSGGLNLMLGSPHNFETEKPQRELIAVSADCDISISDGDW